MYSNYTGGPCSGRRRLRHPYQPAQQTTGVTLCGRCRVFTRFYTILHENEQISIITETFGIIPKISIGPEFLDFLHVFRPTF